MSGLLFNKPVLYFISFATGGYFLMKLVSVQQEKVKQELEGSSGPLNERERQNKLFMDVLKSASESNKPLYRMEQPIKHITEQKKD